MVRTSTSSYRGLLDARPEYRYQRLDPSRRQIRLFELAPAARRSDPVVGSIRLNYVTRGTNRSDEDPDALSYVWGPPTPTFNIMVDGRRLAVTRNLLCALQDIRDPHEEIIIWIDAICIDQKDHREKGHQIQLMRYIYESASVVRVWIGEEIDTSSASFRILKRLDAGGPSIGGGTVMNALGGYPWEFWRPVAKIFLNEYWSRLWIQQELFFPHIRLFYFRNVCLYDFVVMMFEAHIRDNVLNPFEK